MIDPSNDLQVALEAALKVEGALPPEVSGRVYDKPPTAAKYPYIVIGDCQVVPDKADCIDGVEAFPIVDVWSQKGGYPEAKRIAGAIVAALDDKPLTVPGFNVILFELQNYQPLRDPDGITRRVSLIFRSLLQPS
ncbi:DUF3168 domain-containing protein [uncultured Bradyrhizobium sp.]|uniref:DUF3168 domain-containing protein n=1 Tax=uncultured Bradyrhizobium sp. TaxID=199684 RepID=UPI0035CBBA50